MFDINKREIPNLRYLLFEIYQGFQPNNIFKTSFPNYYRTALKSIFSNNNAANNIISTINK